MRFVLVAFRLFLRLCLLLSAFFAYLAQLPALVFGRKKFAARMLSVCSRQLLRSLGINVCIRSDFNWYKTSNGLVHIYNHENPLDVFIIQGYLNLPSITTAGSHLGKVFPFFDRCVRNAGHILLDHMDPASRRSSFSRSFETMEAYGQMIIAPNGSLVTSIYQRASRSPQVLARKFSTLIAPWIFSYGDLRMSRQDLYSPVLILLKRLAAPVATITCSLMEEDLQAIPVGLSKELFEPAVISFYSLRKE
jgi:capsular polysaccharide export protein